MKEYYKGRLRRIEAIYAGVDAVAERWRYGRRVWPDDSDRSNALRVRLPVQGTLDWAYWVHAVDAVRRLGAAGDCYLRLLVGGRYYYLIDAPDGSTPLELEGGMAFLPYGQSFPTDGLGSVVRVEARVPARVGGARAGAARKNQFLVQRSPGVDKYDESVASADVKVDFMRVGSAVSRSHWNELLPLLPGSRFSFQVGKWQREENPRFWIEVRGLASNTVYWRHYGYLVGGGRWDYGGGYALGQASSDFQSGGAHFWWENVWGKNEYEPGAWGFSVEVLSTSTGRDEFCSMDVVFPRFDKVFNLNVINVNTVG